MTAAQKKAEAAATTAAKAAAEATSQANADAAHGTDVTDVLKCRSYAVAPLAKAIEEAGVMSKASPELRLILDLVMSNRDQLAFIGGVVNKLGGKAGAATSTAGASKYK